MPKRTEPVPPIRLFRQGFITSSANPFAVMFFAALFPQFIDPTASTLPQLGILGGTYLLVDGIILIGLGLACPKGLRYAFEGMPSVSSTASAGP